MADYKKKLGASWLHAADRAFYLQKFFYKKGLPLVVVINTKNMKIEFVNVGHAANLIKSSILKLLKQ